MTLLPSGLLLGVVGASLCGVEGEMDRALLLCRDRMHRKTARVTMRIPREMRMLDQIVIISPMDAVFFSPDS